MDDMNQHGILEQTCGARDNQVEVNQSDLVPIGHLPVEILAEIFLLCKTHPRGDNLNGSWFRQWMQVTFVCHQWREVALQTPNLWTELHVGMTDSLNFVRLALERSNSLPITASASVRAATYSNMASSSIVDIVLAILAESHRVESFILGPGFSHHSYALMNDAIPLSMPQLNTLELIGDTGRRPALHGGVLDAFGGIELPALQSLTLSNCYPRFRGTILAPTLTTLHISTVPDPSYNLQMGVSSILTLISHLRLLQSLSLSLIRLEWSPPEIEEALTFASLRHLNIGGDISACAFLLDQLVTPPHPTCVSATTDMEGGAEIVNIISDNFCRWLSGAQATGTSHPDFLTCAIMSHDNIEDPRKVSGSRVSCHLWEGTLQFDAPEVPRPFFQLDTFTNWSQLVVLHIFSTFPLQSIQCLRICGLPFLSLQGSSMRELYDLLVAMPNVTELCVYDDGSGSATSDVRWAEMLSELSFGETPGVGASGNGIASQGSNWEHQSAARRPSSHPIALTLPKLSVLLLEGLAFRSSSYHQDLLDALQERRSAGISIDELVIRRCSGIQKSHAADLQRVVGSVNWDGVSLEPT